MSTDVTAAADAPEQPTTRAIATATGGGKARRVGIGFKTRKTGCEMTSYSAMQAARFERLIGVAY